MWCKSYWPIRALLLFLWLGFSSLAAQNDCQTEKNYSISNFTINGSVQDFTVNDDNSAQLSVGQPNAGRSGSYAQGQSLQHGFWGHYLLQPQSPWLQASEGEHIDHVELRWEVVDDQSGPLVSNSLTKIYRNGRLLTTLPLAQTTYLDYNVFPGEFYTYSVVTTNSLGDSRMRESVGFLNPNGRITGNIKTRNNVPAPDVKVTLTPNLGRCLQFDGQDDYLYFDEKSLKPAINYTIEGWFRNVGVKEQVIFAAVDSLNQNPLIKVSLDANGFLNVFHDGDGNGQSVSLRSQEAYNLTSAERDWQHFAMVHDSTHLFLYLNGQRVAEIPDQDFLSKIAVLEIGKNGTASFDKFYDGYLDDIRLWQIARSREEIRRYKDITLTGEDAGLFAYWKFDEQFGEKIYDYAAKADINDRIHGYVCGAAHADYPTPVQLGAYTDDGGDYLIKGIFYGAGTTFSATPSKQSPIGSALRFFPGDDTYLSLGQDSLPIKDAFTLEGWFKVDTSAAMTLFEARDVSNGNSLLHIYLDAQAKLNYSSSLSGGAQTIRSAERYDDEYWYHFAAVHDGSMMRLYINGTEVGTAANNIAFDKLAHVQFARFANGFQYFVGRLDEFRFWDYARSQNQIQGTLKQVLPGNERGIVESPGLTAYWQFSAGDGEFVSDFTGNGHRGTLQAFRADSVSDGKVVIRNWDGDDIPLKVEFFTHEFEPNARNITLDPTNVSVDRVDFTDISLLTVSGFVRFDGTDCFADSVEVIVNGSPTLPRTFTDEEGSYQVEFEPGTRGHIITFEKADHTFDPSFIELPKMVRPIAGVGISDNTRRHLAGKVFGGECEYSIGPAQVVLTTSPFCYRDTIDVDSTTGSFKFENIPPQHYQVYVLHPNPIIQQFFADEGAMPVSLVEKSDTIQFMYRAPMQIEIAGLDTNTCGLIIVEQNQSQTLTFSIFEQYGDDRCDIPSGTLSLFDDISDEEEQEADFSNGTASYNLKGGEPNMLSGGARPHQKKIQVVAKDSLDRQADATEFAYVTGTKARSVDFATTTPEVPFMILRSPPGDQSSAYFEESTTFGTAWSASLAKDQSLESYLELNLGLSFTTNAGFIFSVQTEISVENTFTASVNSSTSLTSTKEAEFSFTTTDEFATEGSSDVYVGGALNILYGVSDILSIDSLCQIQKDSSILFVPDGFHTTFIYSEDHIEGNVIPELEAIGDSSSAEVWQDILDLNAGLKDSAQFRENISFDASSSFSRSTTQSQTETRTIDMEVAIESSLAHSFGVAVNDAGVGGGTTATMRMAFGESRSSSITRDITTGFTLSDSDNGDNYTVNVKHDPVYGTPVFEMISGATSCPWEGGLKRQGVQLSVDRNAAIDVPSDQSAVFDLTLGNTSETNEASVYHVTLLQESNPDGAIVSLNGVTLTGNNDVAFFIQPGQQINATLTVDKGPQTFDYNDLKIMMFSPCERDAADGAIPDAPFADIEELDISFIELCSPLTMTSPQEGWVIAASQNDLLPITLTDYDLARPDLQSIRLQFRPKIPNAPFVNAITLLKADLNAGFHTFNWDVSQLDDGPYELRAISSCGGSVPDRITPLISGVIDRSAPQLFGTQEPLDGVLGLNDEISITFDEDIICANLISLADPVSLVQGSVNHINLSSTETGLPIEKVVSCQGNKITIVPDIQNRFIEGQVLRVDVLGVEDQYGNVMTTAQTWQFLVVRNPLEWLGGDVDLVVEEGNSTTFQKQLINTGAFDVHYSLSGPLTAGTLLPTLLPPWLTASPMSGIIPPGATETVTFTSSEQLDGGTYEAGIFAANSYGAPALRFDLRVLCPEPDWVVQPDQFDHSMIITAELIVDQDTSVDLYDRIGAFVNGELRGTGELRYVPQLDRYQAYLTVFSNQTQGETVEFQVWDASDCRLYENVLESFPFQMNAVQGTPVAPVYLHTSSDLSRTLSLNQGWTWFSLNLVGQDSTINQMLDELPSQSGDILRNQVAFSQYTPDFGWVGPLNEIDRRSAYQFKQSTSQDLVVRGIPVDIETVSIPIVSGWNWISYLPQNGAELDEALSNLASTTGDIIKNQTTFAQYIENIGWIGSLNFMQPNDGYLLYSDRADTLIYPARLNRRYGRNLAEEAPQPPLDWAVKPEQFLQSMTFTAQIEGRADENAWLAAYSGDEMRGLVKFKDVSVAGQPLAFLTVYGLTEEEVIHFEYYHPKLGSVVPVVNTFGFQENAQYGDPFNPLILDLAISTAVDPIAAGYDLEVFPNPFREQIAIKYVLPDPEHIRIDLTNILGQPVRLLADKKQSAGEYELQWDGTNDTGVRLAAGVYILRLRTDQFEKSIQIILKP